MKQGLIFILLVSSVGCTLFRPVLRVKEPSYPGSVSDVRFERTPERELQELKKEDRIVTARFASCNFRDGMRQLTELTGVPISWDKSLDDETVDGVFVDQPLGEVLNFLARRLNVRVSEQQGMYFLGTVREGDFISAVVRVPPVAREELSGALSKTGSGRATIIGSFIWITDTLENVQKWHC